MRCPSNYSLQTYLEHLQQVRYVTKNISVLPVVCDKNNLVFKKRIQIMNKVIGYSYAKTIMNSTDVFSTLQTFWFKII